MELRVRYDLEATHLSSTRPWRHEVDDPCRGLRDGCLEGAADHWTWPEARSSPGWGLHGGGPGRSSSPLGMAGAPEISERRDDCGLRGGASVSWSRDRGWTVSSRIAFVVRLVALLCAPPQAVEIWRWHILSYRVFLEDKICTRCFAQTYNWPGGRLFVKFMVQVGDW
jgi:hypothetical protein